MSIIDDKFFSICCLTLAEITYWPYFKRVVASAMPARSITNSFTCGVSYKYSLQRRFLAYLVPTLNTSWFLVHSIFGCYVFLCKYRTFTGITKPRRMSVYLKAGFIRSYWSSLRVTYQIEYIRVIQAISPPILTKLRRP